MKICGFLQVYNELEKGNLQRVINNLQKFCDVIGVYDDGSTDGSINYLNNEGCIVVRGHENDFRNEIAHKQQLLDVILDTHQDIDWFFHLDADEILSRAGIEYIRNYCRHIDKGFDGISIRQINLWRSYGWHRTDFYQRAFVRGWRNKPGIHYPTEHGLHKQQYPVGINNIFRLSDDVINYDINVIHFAFITDEQLVKTYKERVALGVPVNTARMRIDETNLQLEKVNLDWFPEDVKIGNTDKPAKKFFGEIPEEYENV